MAEEFLHLPPTEQSQLFRALAPRLGRAPLVLEKDVWVCWVLQHLFEMPDRLPMAFKGGTSLSKVFDAITRFSEDVDITLDYRGLDNHVDPFNAQTSKTQQKKFSESLKDHVREHVFNVVVPHFTQMLKHSFGESDHRITVSDDGEQLRIYYPTTLETSGGYIHQSVLLEFGGRNITEPNAVHAIRPYIADSISELSFPIAQVTVLSPLRTFWEKATLIHVECHRSEFRSNAERLSRHWYDLAMLSAQTIGEHALIEQALLFDVVKHKKLFYNSANAHYDACLMGGFRLIPDANSLSALQIDFERMLNADMFFGNPPSFEWILEQLYILETSINASITSASPSVSISR